MIYPHARFHPLNSNGLLVIVVKPKGEENFQTSTMLLAYIV
jgi:hypothetical protein